MNSHELDLRGRGPLMVGGSDMDGENGDVWEWSGQGWQRWGRGVFPARQAFGLAYDAGREVVVMSGGVVSSRSAPTGDRTCGSGPATSGSPPISARLPPARSDRAVRPALRRARGNDGPASRTLEGSQCISARGHLERRHRTAVVPQGRGRPGASPWMPRLVSATAALRRARRPKPPVRCGGG